MEIVKIEDVNITVKTITINGKKLAKSYFSQIPFGIFVYHNNNNQAIIGYRKDADAKFNGKLLGWINQSAGTAHQIKHLIDKFNCRAYDYPSQIGMDEPIRYFPILFLDKNEKLKRSVIDEKSIDLLNIRDNQIYL